VGAALYLRFSGISVFSRILHRKIPQSNFVRKLFFSSDNCFVGFEWGSMADLWGRSILHNPTFSDWADRKVTMSSKPRKPSDPRRKSKAKQFCTGKRRKKAPSKVLSNIENVCSSAVL